MAEHLCNLAKESGYVATWYLEESDDHPVHSKLMKAQRRDGRNFIEMCLQSWSRFVEKGQKENALYILEGSAFQSTVRFMMEERMPAIDDYYRRFEKLVAPLNPRMVYLRSRDPFQHSQHASKLRGKNWSEKVSSYLEKTKYSRNAGFTGLDGMHRFWADYALLCDQLVAHAQMPIQVIDMVPGDWERHLSEAAGFLGLKCNDAAEVLRFNTIFDTGTPARGSI